MPNAPVTIYGRDHVRVAYCENAFDIGYRLQPNALWRAWFSLPLDDPKNDDISDLYYAEIYDGDTRIELFRIISVRKHRRDGKPILTYHCEHVLGTLMDDTLIGVFNAGPGTTQAINDVLGEQKTENWLLDTNDFARNFYHDWEDVTILKALLSIPTRFTVDHVWTWDTTSYPWRINLETASATVSAKIRYQREMKDIQKDSDARYLYTRLYPFGFGAGADQLDILTVDQMVEGRPEFTSGSTEFTVGETLTGVSSGETAKVTGWLLESGEWSDIIVLKKDLSNATPTQIQVLSLTYDAAHDVLVAGTSQDGQLWVSADGGDTWTLKKDLSDEILDQTYIISLTYDAANEVLVAGTHPGAQLWVSADGGDTWTLKKDLSNETPSQGAIFSLTYDAANEVLVAGTYPDGQIWVSVDGGENWTLKKDLSDETPAQTHITSLTYDVAHGVLVAGTRNDGQLWVSADGGGTWTLKKDLSNETPSQTIVTSLTYDAANEVLVAGTHPDGQLWVSVDGGENWTLKKDLSNETSSQDTIFSLTYDVAHGVLVAGTHPGAQLWVSADGGDTWTLKKDLSNESLAQTEIRALTFDSVNEVLIIGTSPNAQLWVRSLTGGAGDAQGPLFLENMSGAFTDGEDLNGSINGPNCATLDLSLDHVNAITMQENGEKKYGIISRTWYDQRYTIAANLQEQAQARVDENSVPRATYRVSSMDWNRLAGTNQYVLGDLVRIYDSELGIDVDVRITLVRKGDVEGKPGDIEIQLATEEEKFVNFGGIVYADDLDGVKSGTFGKVLSTSISAGKILLSQIAGGQLGAIPSPPTIGGLYLGSDHMGYHDGANWISYFDNAGIMQLNGIGADNAHIQWDPAGGGTLDIKSANVDISGTMTITAGVVGGFNVDPTEGLYIGTGATRVQMKPGVGIWCGATAFADATFSASDAGDLIATSATITGAITISSGSGIANLSDAGALAVEDDLDGVPDGSSYGRIALTEITSGKIVLIGLTASLNINDTTFENAGIQLQYNAGTPQFYVGNGANEFVMLKDSKFQWKAANSELDASGNLTVTNANIRGTLNASDLSAGTIAALRFAINSIVPASLNMNSYLDLNNQALYNCNTLRGGTGTSIHYINLDADIWYGAQTTSYLSLAASPYLRGQTDISIHAGADIYLQAGDDIWFRAGGGAIAKLTAIVATDSVTLKVGHEGLMTFDVGGVLRYVAFREPV